MGAKTAKIRDLIKEVVYETSNNFQKEYVRFYITPLQDDIHNVYTNELSEIKQIYLKRRIYHD